MVKGDDLQMNDDWLAAHLEAERQAQAAEATRAEFAAMNAQLANEHLDFAHEEATREAKTLQICPTHGVPTTIPGMCQACIAEAELSAGTYNPDLGPTFDGWVPKIDDIPGGDAHEHGATPADDPVSMARVNNWTVEVARRRIQDPVDVPRSAPSTHRVDPFRGHSGLHRAASFRVDIAGQVPMAAIQRRPVDEPRPPRPDPERRSEHPRGPVEFYCGNCSVLSRTPGYCTACGAMLKALDSVERIRLTGDHDHHLLPRAFDRSINFWKSRGIDVHEFCVTIPPDYHHQIHQLWNDEWSWFILDHPAATAEKIRAQMYSMMEDYGLATYRIHRFRRKR